MLDVLLAALVLGGLAIIFFAISIIFKDESIEDTVKDAFMKI